MHAVLQLPYPPSANSLWTRTRRGIRKTDAYCAWLVEAGWAVKQQRQPKIPGAYKISIQAVRPDKRRRDLGNLLKATEDLLESAGVIENDSKAEMITMRWVTVGHGMTVIVEPAGVE